MRKFGIEIWHLHPLALEQGHGKYRCGTVELDREKIPKRLTVLTRAFLNVEHTFYCSHGHKFLMASSYSNVDWSFTPSDGKIQTFTPLLLGNAASVEDADTRESISSLPGGHAEPLNRTNALNSSTLSWDDRPIDPAKSFRTDYSKQFSVLTGHSPSSDEIGSSVDSPVHYRQYKHHPGYHYDMPHHSEHPGVYYSYPERYIAYGVPKNGFQTHPAFYHHSYQHHPYEYRSPSPTAHGGPHRSSVVLELSSLLQ
jgi:hypothetical protein